MRTPPGHPYTASTLTVQATDGNTYSYRWDQKNLKAGALVQVTTNGGSVQVTRLSGSGISGKVSTDGTRLGSYALADDVEILDTYGDTQAVRVYPSRLKGVSLRESDVRFYQLDEHGRRPPPHPERGHRRHAPLRCAHPHQRDGYGHGGLRRL